LLDVSEVFLFEPLFEIDDVEFDVEFWAFSDDEVESDRVCLPVTLLVDANLAFSLNGPLNV
jgi:hypothetical protein